ncbi:inhibitor of nuclear factor kappa-B kinase-interacting protein isoform X1 [Gopherus flavomarginatus]|uniref:inhibitor of nuclear factor kappa-B kinase-interacting protein isoform X1 n=1 Tax=Gopherus flavomarginatus TaxID=286002 RepID=UPI0021CC211C|nr:inhibitor of nuclear factor kappa-B kinase-interacting protein isoform X1 [Gopherus flavomarginatus]XP_050791654.1 inhibitor of nuclear factor kappa-B kinase-interacting protein isoform X1 [Gopherus flavomarginatus]XP_050791655.1 inhibitor of nuclear factor kappa-B kinase-interacting protein isoform X1 [Gopherus flavomarginatus]
MSDMKQRKKAVPSQKHNEDPQKQSGDGTISSPRSGSSSQNSFWIDSQTALNLLSLVACLLLTWFLFQQSGQLAHMEKKYHLLQLEAGKCQDMENKVNLISEKLESSESILQEATSSISMMTQFEQEVSTLHNIIQDIQNSEQTFSEKMQSINDTFQNVMDSWKRSLDEMNANTSSLKSEAKFIHTEVTAHINTADQNMKSLSERLKDLEDSTIRNIKTLKRQEEDELSRVEQLLELDTKTVEKLEEEQNILLARDLDLSQKLTDYEPKVEECKTHLPTIENAVQSILRVSSELIGIEKKMEDLTIQVFTIEDEMLKTVSNIMEMQTVLESMQYDNSILKLQNEIIVLKEKVFDITLSSNTREILPLEYNLENEQSQGDDQ